MKNFTQFFIAIATIVAFGSSNVFAAVPTVAAPTPPVRTAPKVISIFSGAYTPVSGAINYNPFWSQATVVTTINVAGDATLSYANLNYQGTEFGVEVNAAGMTHLHIDVYTSDETSLKIYSISKTTGEKFVSLTPINLNAWNSYDIPLTDFTSQGLSMADIFQFKIVGSGGKTVYVDNMYFYDSSASVDTEAPAAFTAVKGLVTFSSVELLLSATDNSNAVSFDVTYGGKTVTVGSVSGVSKSFSVGSLTPETLYSFSVIAKDATGNIAANSPIVVDVTTTAAPSAAPIPTVDASKVISIFSDTYNNIPGANYNPNWSQSTVVTTIDLGGSATLKYDNLNYQGTEFAAIDASSMNYMHVDVWTANETSLKITPISAGKEGIYNLTPLTLGAWNSFDIPLSAFPTVVKSAIIQIKVVGSGGKTVYLDNIFFYDNTATDLSSVEAQNGVKLFPNPATDNVTIVADSEISEVVISNMLGQTVKVASASSLETTLELDQLAAGQYIVTVKQANGTVSNQKIVKK